MEAEGDRCYSSIVIESTLDAGATIPVQVLSLTTEDACCDAANEVGNFTLQELACASDLIIVSSFIEYDIINFKCTKHETYNDDRVIRVDEDLQECCYAGFDAVPIDTTLIEACHEYTEYTVDATQLLPACFRFVEAHREQDGFERHTKIDNEVLDADVCCEMSYIYDDVFLR